MVKQDEELIISDFDSATDYAADYLRTYFMDDPTPDDKALMSFLVERYALLEDSLTLLEVGCGPVINHIMPAAPYVAAIHMADYRHDNLEALRTWVDKRGGHDWIRFTAYILALEGVEPTKEAIDERETLVRERITKLLHCDLRSANPLQSGETYAAVGCYYATEQASSTKEEWRAVMRNLTSLVAPGGHLFTCAVGGCDHYILYDSAGGRKKYPVPTLFEEDYRQILREQDFDESSLVCRYQPLQGQESEGVFGVILVHARRL